MACEPRLAWLRERVCKTLGINVENFNEFLKSGENEAALSAFLNGDGMLRVVFASPPCAGWVAYQLSRQTSDPV
jgi:hypothetical protein